MAEVVGVRLQVVRKFYGWSQRELAKRAGVPNSAISVIEQGSVSPSVTSLEKVLGGFPMTLVDFFSISMDRAACHIVEAKSANSVSNVSNISNVNNEDSPQSLSAHFVAEDHSQSSTLDIRQFSASAESNPGSHFIRDDTLLLVTQGEVLLHTVGLERALSAGDSVSLYAPLPFRLEVLRDEASWVMSSIGNADH